MGSQRPDIQHEFDERLTDIKRLFSEAAGTTPPTASGPTASGPTRLQFVRWILWSRELMENLLTPELFANPALDILLFLYVNRNEGQNVSTSAACAASRVPTTTALRWINALVKRGMVVKRGMPSDRRFTYLELSDEAAEVLDQVLGVILDRLGDPAEN